MFLVDRRLYNHPGPPAARIDMSLGRDALAARYAGEIVAELSSEGPLSETLSLEDRLRSIRLFANALVECETDVENTDPSKCQHLT